jgi:hypothetical protein
MHQHYVSDSQPMEVQKEKKLLEAFLKSARRSYTPSKLFVILIFLDIYFFVMYLNINIYLDAYKRIVFKKLKR